MELTGGVTSFSLRPWFIAPWGKWNAQQSPPSLALSIPMKTPPRKPLISCQVGHEGWGETPSLHLAHTTRHTGLSQHTRPQSPWRKEASSYRTGVGKCAEGEENGSTLGLEPGSVLTLGRCLNFSKLPFQPLSTSC